LTKALFAAALLLGAALIFWAELLTARLLLPLLGGSASVWNTTLVFFQVALLAGYLYAHASVRWATHRYGVLLHPALLLVAALMLPISMRGLAAPTGGENPILWQLAALSIMVGPPFVILAGTASLLQAWYARLGAAGSRDPYFLYAASNLGSLAALVSYPTLIEPNLRLATQNGFWTAGYLGVAALTAACAVVAGLAGSGAAPATEPPATTAEEGDRRTRWLQRARWVVLAFVPSSLLLGVTTHLTMNIAAAPLFWVIPLALYLLSFVVAFQSLVPLPERWTGWLQAVLLVALALTFLNGEAGPSLALFALNLAAFFTTALLCHQMVARQRPPPARLTEFYLLIALGGALGGVFNALLAPVIFSRVIEYPLILVLACLLRPGALPSRKAWPAAVLDLAVPGALLGALLALMHFAAVDFTDLNGDAQVLVMVGGLIVFATQARPVRLALAIGALILAGANTTGETGPEVANARNFYGILRVVNRSAPRAGERDDRTWRPEPRPGPPLTTVELLPSGWPARSAVRPDRRRAADQRCGGGRPRRRLGRLLRACRRALDVLRDQPGGPGDRAQSRAVHVSARLPLQAKRRARRRPAVIGAPTRRRLRPDHPGRLQLRRHPDASDDARGDAALPGQAQAGRDRGVPHLQPVPRSGSGGRGDRPRPGHDRAPLLRPERHRHRQWSELDHRYGLSGRFGLGGRGAKPRRPGAHRERPALARSCAVGEGAGLDRRLFGCVRRLPAPAGNLTEPVRRQARVRPVCALASPRSP
jgi:hypothetical protein